MSYLSSFYVKKDTKFTKQLLGALETEIKANKMYVESYYLSEEEIMIHIPSFETIHLCATANIKSREGISRLMMKGYVLMPDGTVFSGFKHNCGNKNVAANIFMLIIKYYLKSKVVIALDDYGCGGLSTDFLKALDYVNKKGYNIEAKPRPNSSSPYIKINGKSVGNEYDRGGKIFNSMLKRVDA